MLTSIPPTTECSPARFAANATEADVRLLHHKLQEAVPIVAPHGVVVDHGEIAGQAAIVDYRPGKFLISTSVDKQAHVIVRESYFDGWKAFVNGVAAPIYPAAGLFFAVPVPPGSSEVLVTYQVPGFRVGLQIAIGWIVLSGVIGVWGIWGFWRTELTIDDRDRRTPNLPAGSPPSTAKAASRD